MKKTNRFPQPEKPNKHWQKIRFRKKWSGIKPYQQVHRNPKDVEKERRWNWNSNSNFEEE